MNRRTHDGQANREVNWVIMAMTLRRTRSFASFVTPAANNQKSNSYQQAQNTSTVPKLLHLRHDTNKEPQNGTQFCCKTSKWPTESNTSNQHMKHSPIHDTWIKKTCSTKTYSSNKLPKFLDPFNLLHHVTHGPVCGECLSFLHVCTICRDGGYFKLRQRGEKTRREREV